MGEEVVFCIIATVDDFKVVVELKSIKCPEELNDVSFDFFI